MKGWGNLARLEQPEYKAGACPKCGGTLEARKGENDHCVNCGLDVTPQRLAQLKKGEL